MQKKDAPIKIRPIQIFPSSEDRSIITDQSSHRDRLESSSITEIKQPRMMKLYRASKAADSES